MRFADRIPSLGLKVALLFSIAGLPVLAQSVNGACIYALDPSAQQAFYISGSSTSSSDCSIVVESSASAAFEMGGTDTLYLGNHAEVGVVGGWQLNGQSMIDTISNQPVQPTTITSPGDPLASLAAPSQGTIVSASPVSYDKNNPPVNNTISPGVYCGGLFIGDTNGAQFTMSPGTYIMAGGGLKITSSAIVDGTGITVYNTSSNGWNCPSSYAYTPITIDGQAKVTLSAPTSGSLAGIVLFGDRNGCATPGSCQDDVNGKATATFNGVLYFKSDQLLLNGSSLNGGCMAVVADMITINGNSTLGGNGCWLNPIAVSVAPPSTALYGGQTQQFTATVTNTYFTDVTWSISPAGAGTIDASGNYTAPTTIATQQTVTVTATSQADTTKSASATITLFPPMTISVSPTAATLYGGQEQAFSAVVTNTLNPAVAWSVSPAGVGAIDASGVYTAPVNITAQQTVTLTATSQANPALSASAAVTLLPPITISLNPSTVTLNSGQTAQFNATLANTSNTTVIWSINPSGVGTISASGLYTAPTTITAQQTVTVTATSQADPTKSASAAVTLLSATLNPTLSLAAAIPPPYVVGAPEQFTVTLKSHDGTPLSGVVVTFTVTGVNSSSGTGTTNSSGIATFAYTGANSGNDTIQATASAEGVPVTSNILIAGWVVPVNPISTTTVLGRFFPLYAPCCAFSATPANTPAFSETFPTIDFDPPSGAIPGNNSVGDGTVPFTDVTVGSDGNFSGTIVAQGNGYQAWNGSLRAFQAVFTGSFIVANAGQQKITVFVDNAFTMGIGGGATAVSWSGGGVSAFNKYPVMGALNTSIGGTSFTVNFPGPGTYPYELDYVEDGAGLASVMMMAGTTGSNGLAPGVPSGGTLTLSPNSVQAQPLGGQQAFTVVETDASGNPVPNLSVGLVVSQDDNEQISKVTDSTGTARFTYTNTGPGTDQVQAIAFIDGMVVYSNQVMVPWGSSPGTGTGSGSNGTLSLSISAPNTVILPNTLSLSGTATDSSLPSGDSISTIWNEVSGPGGVSFANPQQLSTTASFIASGTYVLELTASDVNGSASAQIQVTVDPEPGVTQGWIGSPADGAAVSGIVPITVASGVTLQSGTLTYYPATNPNNVTVLNANTTGSGQIGTLDTTTLANGSYWITLQATNTSGGTEYNLAMVTVTGNYKPGRVTSTVTDLVVPATGLAINIQRRYDSLNAGISGDFGYGWSLGTSVDLTVGPRGDVTFTLGGQRKTFYLTPQFGGWLFPYYFPAFSPEPGMYGTLSPAGSGCPDLFDFLVPDGNLWACIGGGFYTPQGYVYTDPSGTSYTITATGNLQSIVDKDGNALTIGKNGITSSTGLQVSFARDSSGRITTITDPQGNQYLYSYDTSGNLASVTYPNTSQPSTYTYDASHHYLSGTDFRGDPLPTTDYYTSSDTDASGNSLAGRLKSVTDALGETTSYAYDVTTNTTTVTYPPDASGNVGTATMVYDAYGDLLSSTDPLGHQTKYVYDSHRNLTSVTDPLNHITSYTYDANGNRTSVTYPQTATSSNTTSTTQYNQFSEPTSTTDELGNSRTFNYDINYNPQSVTDSTGTLASFQFNTNGTLQAGAIGYDVSADTSKASHFAYDANGNMTSRTDALGRTTSYTYDSLGHKISMTEPLPSSNTSQAAATTSYTYDALGNLTQTSAPLGRVTSSQYDGNGNRTSSTDARGNTTTYQYDGLNRLVLTTYPTQPVTTSSKTYDFRGNVVRETDQAGHVTLHQYDLAGRETSVTQAYGTSNATTTTYAYDDAGRKVSETDSLGHATTYTYDAAGNLTAISGPKGNFQYAYDDARNRVSVTDGNNNTTSYQYDGRKRLVETDYPDGTKKTNAYDGPGNLVSVADQAGNEVQYTYDAANQLQTVVQLNGSNTTSYSYDALGNLTGLTDANSHTTQSSFDLLLQPISKTLPDGSLQETRQYDQAGNLTSLVHFNGVTTTYTYDTLNRLVSRATPGEATVSFTYTATGKRATMTDASGTTNYSYDNMDRLSSKATPEGTLSYTYDAAGNLASMTSSNPNGVSVSYTYDSLNRLATVVDSRLGTTSYSYDPASNLGTVTYPNNVQTTFQYDPLNRVTGVSSATGGYTYQLGPTGNRTSALEQNGRSITWSYDGIYRLTSEAITSDPSKNNGSVSYGLDPVGNRDSVVSSLGVVPSGNYSYNADDQLSTESYDQNGNTIATDGKTLSYDSENHLVSMNGGAVQMLYDGDGNRVAKSVSGVVTRYLVDDLNPTGYPQVADELTSGVVTRTYSYGLQRISEDQVISNTWTPSFYSYDGGGNVRALTNTAGAMTDTYEYDAFGNEPNKTGSTPNSYLYRGEFFDSDLGLYYLRARWMNPLTGRFMSRDPEDGRSVDPRTLHKYLYAGGDPVNWVDPRGRGATLEFLFTTADISTPTEAAVAGLTQGAAQWTAIVQLYAGSAYLTAQEILVEMETAETTGIIIKFLACEYIGTEVTEFLSSRNNTELQKFIVGEVFSHGCFDYIEPYPF